MKDQSFNSRDSIQVIIILSKLRRVCDLSGFHEGTDVRFLRDFMNVPPLQLSKHGRSCRQKAQTDINVLSRLMPKQLTPDYHFMPEAPWLWGQMTSSESLNKAQ